MPERAGLEAGAVDIGRPGGVFVVAELEQAGFGDQCDFLTNNVNPRGPTPIDLVTLDPVHS